MWMRSNRLQLNTAKTEILSSTMDDVLISCQCRSYHFELALTKSFHLLLCVTMRSHVMKTAVLRQLRSIRWSVPRSVLQSLVTSLVLTLLDYGNSTLAGILLYLLKRLQSVMNSAASSPLLIVRRTRLSTIGDRAFPVAAARVWNGLPHHVTSAPSLAVFHSRLKTHLFRSCFP